MKSGLLKHTMEIRDVTITKIIVIYIECLSTKVTELEKIKKWKNGKMEYWNNGMMEEWNVGTFERT